jgi:quinol monooxygenase YgiN
MVIQIVKASIDPEQRDRWLEVIRDNAEGTRAAEGCEGYQVAEDLEAPNSFVIIELWSSMEAVHDHFRKQFGDLMARLEGVFAGPPEATFYEVASTQALDEVLAAVGIAQ